jgi:uncharacterized protein DUF6941
VQPPDVLALVIADSVLVEAGSQKCYIQGTYSTIMAAAFPIMSPRIFVYVAITNGHGKTPMILRIVDVDETHAPLVVSELSIDFPDPLTVVEGVFILQGVTFPRAGEYRLQLFGAGQPLRERRLQVVPAVPASGKQEEGESEHDK